ncbi:6,7-dimethyl-8-ribityllumazine synthase [Sulfolobales archaeon HS-7]|nr:6,7-dimethyl-8-ribityllumazine synthase [Sulfolobales archaeon HS-7]
MRVTLGLVVAEFNYEITYLMLQRALEHAKFLDAEVKVVMKVPGTYDTPLAVKKVIERFNPDAVAVLGAVIKGETKHDDLVANQASRMLMDISVEKGVPVTMGIIGPGASREQAMERIEEYSTRAIEAAIKLALRYKKMSETKYEGNTVFIE